MRNLTPGVRAPSRIGGDFVPWCGVLLLTQCAVDVAGPFPQPWGVALKCARLSSAIPVDPAEGGLPGSFLIFRAGVNEASHVGGPLERFTFDAVAAALVLGAWRKTGVDVCIDLEHASVDGSSTFRADAMDAMGWCQLELSSDGELWAVNVRWSAEGERRLTSRLQRYISPAFLTNDAGRIISIINLALCSMPATHKARPLIAASRKARRPMDPKLIEEAMAAVKDQDGAKALTLLEALLTAAAGGGGESEGPPDPPAEGAPDAAPAAAAALSLMTELTQLRAAVSAQGEELAKLKGKREGDEMVSRLSCVRTLIELGAESPATVWDGDPASGKLVRRLMAEPIDELAERVAKLSATLATRPQHRPPADDVTALSASDRKIAEGITDPKRRDHFISLRLSRTKGNK